MRASAWLAISAATSSWPSLLARSAGVAPFCAPSNHISDQHALQLRGIGCMPHACCPAALIRQAFGNLALRQNLLNSTLGE